LPVFPLKKTFYSTATIASGSSARAINASDLLLGGDVAAKTN